MASTTAPAKIITRGVRQLEARACGAVLMDQRTLGIETDKRPSLHGLAQVPNGLGRMAALHEVARVYLRLGDLTSYRTSSITCCLQEPLWQRITLL